MLAGSSNTTLWVGLFLMPGCFWLVLFTLCFIEIPVFNAKGVDPYQTPRSAAPDLGLHCLPITILYPAHNGLLWENHQNHLTYLL